MEIRFATMADLAAVTEAEALCFPAAEAAPEEQFRGRLAAYRDHFWLLFDGDRLVSFVDGPVTMQPDLTDEMFADPGFHREDGGWQMIFGVATIPEYQRQGCAGRLLRRAISDARAQSRLGLVLTCKERLIPYYARFGFVSEGLSASVHGNAVWYQMRLRL